MHHSNRARRDQVIDANHGKLELSRKPVERLSRLAVRVLLRDEDEEDGWDRHEVIGIVGTSLVPQTSLKSKLISHPQNNQHSSCKKHENSVTGWTSGNTSSKTPGSSPSQPFWLNCTPTPCGTSTTLPAKYRAPCCSASSLSSRSSSTRSSTPSPWCTAKSFGRFSLLPFCLCSGCSSGSSCGRCELRCLGSARH